jgi:hypothetical protein
MLLNNTKKKKILKCIYFVINLKKYGRHEKMFHLAPVSPNINRTIKGNWSGLAALEPPTEMCPCLSFPIN